MKLFTEKHADHFVFAVCPKGYKEGTKPNYAPVKAADVETALKQLDAERLVNVYPHVMGRYDHLGRYCTYQPPIEGIRPGKFILHPVADAEYKASRPY